MHNPENIWVCSVCECRYKTQKRLRLHLMTHTSAHSSCPHCEMKFTFEKYLKVHMRVHHGNYNSMCEHCQKRFITLKSCNTHIIRTHFAKINCEIFKCLYKASSKKDYKAHLLEIHEDIGADLLKLLLDQIEKLEPNLSTLKFEWCLSSCNKSFFILLKIPIKSFKQFYISYFLMPIKFEFQVYFGSR